MSLSAPVLAEGALIAGRYQIRRALGGDDDARLYVAVDDGGARPELKVLLTRPTGAVADLRSGGWRGSGLVAELLDRLELDGGEALVLGASGGISLAEPLPQRNDLWMAELVLVLADLLAELSQAGIDLDQVTAARLLLVAGDPGMRFVGPVLAAAGPGDAAGALARLRDELAHQEGPWTDEFVGFVRAWRAGRYGSLGELAAAAGDLCEPGHVVGDVGIVSNVGLYRRQNEDAAVRLEEQQISGDGATSWTLVALADGMGGHRGGRQASQLALHTLATALAWQGAAAAMEGHRPRWDDNACTSEMLLSAVEEAHRAVNALAEAGEERAPGCTLTAGLLLDRRLFLAHVGDSRAYLLRNGTLERITRDDTMVQAMVDQGGLSADQARSHPAGHVLTQALGQSGTVTPARYLRLVFGGDRLMFCSDGVTESLDDAALAELLAQAAPAANVAEAIVVAALEAGSRDNVTVIVHDLR